MNTADYNPTPYAVNLTGFVVLDDAETFSAVEGCRFFYWTSNNVEELDDKTIKSLYDSRGGGYIDIQAAMNYIHWNYHNFIRFCKENNYIGCNEMNPRPAKHYFRDEDFNAGEVPEDTDERSSSST